MGVIFNFPGKKIRNKFVFSKSFNRQVQFNSEKMLIYNELIIHFSIQHEGKRVVLFVYYACAEPQV
jgi:hypothetical protein